MDCSNPEGSRGGVSRNIEMCSKDGNVWAPPTSAHYGVEQHHASWTVQTAAASGHGPMSRRHERRAYFVVTAANFVSIDNTVPAIAAACSDNDQVLPMSRHIGATYLTRPHNVGYSTPDRKPPPRPGAGRYRSSSRHLRQRQRFPASVP